MPRAARLITCACPFAAKKWPVLAARPNRRNWTSRLKNGPHRPHGKSDFPVEPARTDGWSRRRRAGSGVTVRRVAQARSRSHSRPKPTRSRCAPAARIRPSGRLPGPTFGSGAANPSKSALRTTCRSRQFRLARDRYRLGRTAHGAAAGRQRGPKNPSRFHCDTPERSCVISSLLGDGQARPSRARALIVQEKEPVTADRDEILLIEDWRLRPDGTAVAPGTDPKDAAPVFTINGRLAPDFTCRLQRTAEAPLHQRLPTGCYCGQIGGT